MAEARRAALRVREEEDGLTPAVLTAAIRRCLPADAIVLNEGITNYGVIFDHLAMTPPGAIHASGGGSLGWSGGAAIGVKLAAPERTVVSLCGDGCFLFSVPSSVHWMARRHEAPFLQVIYNNGGWSAPRHSALALHPAGHAARAANLDLGFEPAPDHAAIAVAAGAGWGRRIARRDDLDDALEEALGVVRGGRSALLDARLAIA